MRLVGLSVVKNEADVIELFVRHNLQYLDQLRILDNGSSDGTDGVLKELSREGLPVAYDSDATFGHHQARRMTALFRSVVFRGEADFAFLLDADEFIKTDSRVALEKELAVIENGECGLIPWETYVVPPDQLLDDNPNALTTMTFRRRRESPRYYKGVVPCRPTRARRYSIMEGNHRARESRWHKLVERKLAGIALAHFPVRSRSQLVMKILDGWLACLAKDPNIAKTGEARHWRVLYEHLTVNGIHRDDLFRISANYATSTPLAEVELSELLYDPVVTQASRHYEPRSECDPLMVLAKSADQAIRVAAKHGGWFRRIFG